MDGDTSEDVLDLRDRRLVAALQCDGRLRAERAAEVLGLPVRVVHRRWAALLGSGAVRIVPSPLTRARAGLLLRVKVLRGRTEAVAAALAERDDVPFVDVSAGGDEIAAVLLADPGVPHRLVFRQLPATGAVTDVETQTILHVFATAEDWRLDVLTPDERAALTYPKHDVQGEPDDLDRALLAALAADARLPAVAVAARTGHPESTVRRRLAALRANGLFRTHLHVDARRLGLPIDANVRLQVPPGALDGVGRALAAHPSVHGALATTGATNLHLAVWLPDLPDLYRFLTEDIGRHGVPAADVLLVGRAVKRPGSA
ncbi:Lrp/AsnC family transcriptional regulator [Actinomadura flavalba]|uniref:Lrp/AsnC family transcriptional regulator n=1 Tax=Actinomadura flavalba TaxID=1120938 RepID=UPI0003732D9F|nr:Lrp/AsnC family transcriptional regulator [Actinomadura flavalba]